MLKNERNIRGKEQSTCTEIQHPPRGVRRDEALLLAFPAPVYAVGEARPDMGHVHVRYARWTKQEMTRRAQDLPQRREESERQPEPKTIQRS